MNKILSFTPKSEVKQYSNTVMAIKHRPNSKKANQIADFTPIKPVAILSPFKNENTAILPAQQQVNIDITKGSLTLDQSPNIKDELKH